MHRRDAKGHAAQATQRFRSRPDLLPPRVTMARRAHAGPGEPLIFTEVHAGTGQQGPLVLDRAGRLVWFLPVSDKGSAARRAFNVRVQSYRGQPVLSWFEGAVVSGHGQGHYEIWDQHYRRIAQVHGADGLFGDLHEFVITDRGTALFTCYGQAEGQIPVHKGTGMRQGAFFYGVAQEVDIATGKLLFQWRSIDHVPVADSFHTPPPANPLVPWDYFHINSIAVDPTDQNLLISSRNTWTVYKVDRSSGAVIWRLGGKHSDFRVARRGHFAFQHDVTLHPGGLLTIFDNEGGPPMEARQSRGLVLRLDERRRRASFVRSYVHHPSVLSPALGSVEPLAGGGAFVGWGDSSWFTEYDSRGHVVLDGHLPSGCISYRAFEQPWTGRPRTNPALTVARAHHGADLYASWNGSTEHRHWRVLSGADAASLHEWGTVDVKGFETRINVRRPHAWVAVEALDAHGGVLGRSKPQRV
ncbi:MAG: arylsulfotransferase family protein [Solirubrobacteraceae bacterium]